MSDEQQPVAWMRQRDMDVMNTSQRGASKYIVSNVRFDGISCTVPLYAAPQPQQGVVEALPWWKEEARIAWDSVEELRRENLRLKDRIKWFDEREERQALKAQDGGE